MSGSPNCTNSIRKYSPLTDEEREAMKHPSLKNRKRFTWGMVPVTPLADDFVAALSAIPNKEHQVMSCTAFELSEAEKFAEKHKIPHVYTSFQEFAKCPHCDAAYISHEPICHFELAMLLLKNGKHVLCERPMCLNESQALQLVAEAQRNGRFLMEGMWPRFTPAYAYIKERIDCGAFGQILEVDCSLGWPLKDMKHVMQLATGGGVTTELGGYAVQLVLWAFRSLPIKIEATGELKDGVDIETEIEIFFNLERSAKIKLSATEKLDNSAKIVGEHGTMTVPEFWCPTWVIDTDEKVECFTLPQTGTKTQLEKRVGMCYEAEEMRSCIMKKLVQSKLYNHSETLMVARILDEVRNQIGVEYDADKEKPSDETTVG